MALPSNRIKQISVPAENGTQTYDIIPEMLGKDGYSAELPTLSANSILGLSTESVYNVFTVNSIAGSSTTATLKSVRWYVSDVAGITEPYNGMKIMIKIPLAGTSTSGAVLSINNNVDENYHPVAYNLNTVFTTHYPVNTYKILVYDASATMTCYLTSGEATTITGVWKGESNYDSGNTNTIGYQVRTNSALWKNKTGVAMNRYALFFEVNDGLSGAATTIGTGTTKTTVAFKYIPGGVIKYYSTSGSITNGSNFSASGLWDQYVLDLRYTFNTGSTLTSGQPVYIRMIKNSDGTLTPDYQGSPSHPIVQALPTTEDDKVYVYLGQAYSTTNIELYNNHPIYEYKDGKIQLYSGQTGGGSQGPDTYLVSASASGNTLTITPNSGNDITFTDTNTTYTFAEGTTDGAFSVTPSGGSAETVNIHGLGSAAYKSTGTSSGNIPVLDINGKLAESVIPAVAITDTYEAATEAAMLALSAQKGDICIRSDLNKSFVLSATPASTLANWKELKTPTDAVLSVAGKTGAVTLGASDVGITVTTTSVSDGTNTFNKYSHPAATAHTAAAIKVGNDSTGHVVLGDALTPSDLGITITTSSVSDGTNTFNKYTHPTTTAVTASAKKVGYDSLGHVVLGDSLTASDVGALANTVKYGASLSVSGKSVQLKDQDGNNLGSAITTQDTDTWRNIQVDGTQKLATGTNTGALNFVSQNTNNGDITFTYDSGIKATAKMPTSLPANGGNADTVDNKHATDFVAKAGDSMNGQLIAQNNVAYSTAQVRNIILSTSEPTSTDGANGDIWIVYNN